MGRFSSFPRRAQLSPLRVLRHERRRALPPRSLIAHLPKPHLPTPQLPTAPMRTADRPWPDRGAPAHTQRRRPESGPVVINGDGTVDTLATNGDRTHATVNVSDPENVPGTSVTHLGVVNGVQRRYPDGSISTRVTFGGRLANGKVTGTWYDKFQTGQFE